MERLHERGKGVHVWTVNQSSEMEQMHLMGVDNIITDAPARARGGNLRRRYGGRIDGIPAAGAALKDKRKE